mgnify:CR=1 FL=1
MARLASNLGFVGKGTSLVRENLDLRLSLLLSCFSIAQPRALGMQFPARSHRGTLAI